MRIDIKGIRENTVSVLPFSFCEDISDIEPTSALPIEVTGEIRNRAGVLFLTMDIEGKLSLVCDRCACEFERKKSVFYEVVIADHTDGDDNDDIIVCEGDMLDLSELAVPTFILNLDSKNLCSENCKGLCQQCGANLNEQACGCKAESTDPRLEILAQLLDD